MAASNPPTNVVVTIDSPQTPSATVTWDWPVLARGVGSSSEAEISYKTASWHVWTTVVYPVSSKSGFSMNYNYTYYMRVRVRYKMAGVWQDWSTYVESSAFITYGDTFEETLTFAESYTDVPSYVDTFRETIYYSDGADATIVVPLRDDFQYYLGSYGGKLYAENIGYASDNNEKIPTYYYTPQSDFAQSDMRFHGTFKTVYKLRLWYTDIHATASYTISVSADGGITWTTAVVSVGTGDETDKLQDFFLLKTGHNFTFKVENNTTTDLIKWHALEVFFRNAGEVF